MLPRRPLFLGVVLAVSAYWSVPGDVFDPKPRGAQVPSTSGQPSTEQRREVRQDLTGYAIGRYVHSGTPRLCVRVVHDIESWERQGWVVDRIVIRGYADGIPNAGVVVDETTLAASCRSRMAPKEADLELARLRACTALYALQRTPFFDRPVAMTWVTDEFDEPDGGRTGPSYRKVQISIALRR